MSIRLGWCWVNRLLALICIIAPFVSKAAVEEKFNVLQIGTRTYTNVTVTTKTKTQIFIIHSTGMHTIKVADLSPEVLTRLGYGTEPEKKPSRGLASLGEMTRKANLKFSLPQLKQFQTQVRGNNSFAAINWSTNTLLTLFSIVVVLYLFFSFCAMLICQKAGEPPGVLIWIPVLQLIPMLRAAQMSPAWIIAFLVPFLNIIAHIVWSFNIANARGKSSLTGVLLILPITYPFAFLYLALSNGTPKKEAPVVEIMTLEAA